MVEHGNAYDWGASLIQQLCELALWDYRILTLMLCAGYPTDGSTPLYDDALDGGANFVWTLRESLEPFVLQRCADYTKEICVVFRCDGQHGQEIVMDLLVRFRVQSALWSMLLHMGHAS